MTQQHDDGQVYEHMSMNVSEPSQAICAPVTLAQLVSAMSMFAAERDWGQFHTPRNLLLALVRLACRGGGEVGARRASGAPPWPGSIPRLADQTEGESG